MLSPICHVGLPRLRTWREGGGESSCAEEHGVNELYYGILLLFFRHYPEKGEEWRYY